MAKGFVDQKNEIKQKRNARHFEWCVCSKWVDAAGS